MRLPLATLLVAAALAGPADCFTWPSWPRAALRFLHLPAGTPAAPGGHSAAQYTVADYVREFGREYSEEERPWREALIASKLAAVKQHNAGGHAYQLGVNQFTDRSEAELRALGGARPSGGAAGVYGGQGLQQGPPGVTFSPSERASAQIDWRSRGVMTAVKNQMQCGSCWAFAAVEVIEAQFALTSGGRLENLSEQQILDCTPNPQECGGDGGCAGGTYTLAFEAAMDGMNGGIASEWTYPYVSAHGGNVGPCHYSTQLTPPVARVTGYVRLPVNDLDAVLHALLNVGPLAVSVDASAWYQYQSGVFTGCDLESPTLDHAVLLVGVGTDEMSGLPYWLIRNSWGSAWGEGGYIRVLRQLDPQCAADVRPWEGDACRNVTDPVKEVNVCGSCGILYDVAYPIVQPADGGHHLEQGPAQAAGAAVAR